MYGQHGRPSLFRQTVLAAAFSAVSLAAVPSMVQAQELAAVTAPVEEVSVAPSLRHRLTPSFSIAPRSIFRRRGPRGAKFDYAKQSVWLSANVHDLLPRTVASYWPAPVRLSVGRRGLGAGLPGEYAVGLDLDASRLPGTHPVWMQAKRVLHAVRLPGPAIVMGPSGTRAFGLYW